MMALAALALPLTSCGQETAAATVVDNTVLVSTISPETGNIIVMGEYIGHMEPNQQVAVLPRIPGEVLSVYFGVGDRVEAGDVLFILDTADLEANITALQAQLEVQDAMVRAAQTGVQLIDGSAMQSQVLQADGGVNQAEAGINQAIQGVEQARIGVEQAQMAYDMANQAFNDTTTLFEAGIVARSAFDQAEAGYLNAQAGLERALVGYTQAQLGLSQAEMGHAQALEGQRILTEQTPVENRRRAQDGLAQAQAARNAVAVNLETTMDRLDDAIVTSPISGVVIQRNVDAFGFAGPQAPAFIISDDESMVVSFRVPRNSVEHLSIGDSVTLQDNGYALAGTITEIASMVDMGGLVNIRATIPNPPAGMIAGTSVRIFANAQRADNAMVLPLNAIHHERGIAHVFIAENGIASRVPVELGVFDAYYAQILSGISMNDEIIITWSARLTDGAEINIVSGE